MNKFMAVYIALAAACAHGEVKISASRDWTTNLVHNATNDLARSLPKPDYSPSNATLRATIQEVAPAYGEYSIVSNKAMNAVTTNNLGVAGIFGGGYGLFLHPVTGTIEWEGPDTSGYFALPKSGGGTLARISDLPYVPAWAQVPTPPYLEVESDPSVGLTNGTPYVKGTALPSFSTVTGAVQSVVSVTSRYIWDDADEVLYRIDMSGGNTYETPVTNVNALLPENSHILIYLEEHKEQFK